MARRLKSARVEEIMKSTWKYLGLQGQSKIDWAESELRYEQAQGTHTYHQCKCKRKMCRSNYCVLCWQEEIQRLRTGKNGQLGWFI